MGIDEQLDIAFGKTLRELRTSKKLTQEELGLEAGLRRTYISSLELGEKQPSLRTILKLTLALEVSMADFFKKFEKQLNNSN